MYMLKLILIILSCFFLGIKPMAQIKKYRIDYENVIIDMEDYVNNMMLQTVLSIDYTNEASAMEKLRTLNVLQESKQSLNATMKFVDSQ